MGYNNVVPSEISHVIYAARMLNSLSPAVTTPSYWAGTLFPNINHVGARLRHPTHIEKVSLGTLIGADDFITGMRVHAWVDASHENFWQVYRLKERLPWHPMVPLAFNLLEDELLYGHFDDWNLLLRSLNVFNEQEHRYCSDFSKLSLWHTVIKDYLATAPSDQTRAMFLKSQSLSGSDIKTVNYYVGLLKKDHSAEKLLISYWQHLEDLLR